MPSGEAASTNVIIFCLTQPCLVRMIYRTRGEHIYHYTTDALILSMLMQWNSQKPAPLKTKGLVLVSSGKIFAIKCQPVVKKQFIYMATGYYFDCDRTGVRFKIESSVFGCSVN